MLNNLIRKIQAHLFATFQAQGMSYDEIELSVKPLVEHINEQAKGMNFGALKIVTMKTPEQILKEFNIEV